MVITHQHQQGLTPQPAPSTKAPSCRDLIDFSCFLLSSKRLLNVFGNRLVGSFATRRALPTSGTGEQYHWSIAFHKIATNHMWNIEIPLLVHWIAEDGKKSRIEILGSSYCTKWQRNHRFIGSHKMWNIKISSVHWIAKIIPWCSGRHKEGVVVSV